MVRNHIFITLLLCLISTAIFAAPWQDPDKEPGNAVGDVAGEPGKQVKDPSEDNSRTPSNINLSVEEAERQKIIAELTYRLETKLTCTRKLTWSDKGSGADIDGYFFSPSAESSYHIVGGVASRTGNPNSIKCVISVRQSKDNPEETPVLLVPPSDWSLIWTDKGSGANTDGSMWNGVSPDKEYKCLGSVIRRGYKKPVLENYRCVHSSLTKKIISKSVLWSDKGSGADRDVTVFKLPNSKSFFAVGRKTNKVKTHDLNDTASAEPDAAVVEKLLAQRMEEINKIEEVEKKRLTDDEAKKQIAEQKRIAESKRMAEEKRIAEETEAQERLSEAIENQRLEQKAEKKRKAEESEQQERLAVEAEKEKLEQETEDIQKAEEPQQQSAAEVVVVQQPDMNKEINQQQAIEKIGEEDSRIGLKILFASLLLLLIYIIYRLFRAFINIIKGDN